MRSGALFIDINVTNINFLDLTTAVGSNATNNCDTAIFADAVILPLCYNLTGTSACSNNGWCTSFNNCTCLDGYYGQQCAQYDCYGISFNSTNVCSGRGTCVGPNQCICGSLYSGSSCQDYACNPLYISNSSNYNQRNCAGYTYLSEINNNPIASWPRYQSMDIGGYDIMCYKDGRNMSFCKYMCAMDLTCMSYNEVGSIGGDWPKGGCCYKYSQTGASSSQASIYYGPFTRSIPYMSNDYTSPMFSNAFAIVGGRPYYKSIVQVPPAATPTTTRIKLGARYYRFQATIGINDSSIGQCGGGNAEQVYFSVVGDGNTLYSSPLMRGGALFVDVNINGVTTLDLITTAGSNLTNNCDTAIFADPILMPLCYGRTGLSACSNNGTCISFNNCTCMSGYYGSQCEAFDCYGVPSNSTNTCSGRGVCVAPNQCKCGNLYSGASCQDYACNPLYISNSSNYNQRNCAGYTYLSEINNNPIASWPRYQSMDIGGYDIMCYHDGRNMSFCKYMCAMDLTCMSYNEVPIQGGSWSVGGCCYKYSQTGASSSQASIYYGPFTRSIPYMSNDYTSPMFSNAFAIVGGRPYYKSIVQVPPAATPTTTRIKLGARYYRFQATIGINDSSIGQCGGGNAEQVYFSVVGDGNTLYSSPLMRGGALFVDVNINGVTTLDLITTAGSNLTNNCDTAIFADPILMPLCYGRTGPSACSNNGACLSFNNCTCMSGYYGLQCEAFDCFGKIFNSSSACSTNGTCVAPNTCNCNNNFYGNNCQNYNCFGVIYNSQSVCSGNGTCQSYNTCQCKSKYYGLQCEAYNCYGTIFNSTKVCSGNGTCASPDTCVCNNNYYGQRCESYNCYGTLFNSSSVCSTNGTCSSPNTCNCNPGYTNSECQNWFCGATLNNNPSVCSSNGTCVAPNTCNCNPGYYGSSCQSWNCNGVVRTSNAGCSNNGTCIAPDTCNCNPGYSGSSCQSWSCNGVVRTNNAGCSNNGTCTSPNTCTCNTGYYGSSCQFYSCGGIVNTDNSGCSNNGTCVAPDTCTCNPGYVGSRCQTWSCNGIDRTNTSLVCNGQGSCVGPNNCQCNPGSIYYGPTCNLYSCYGVASTAASVCSGRGVCVTKDT
ncbi:hypothetical protein AKO1_010380, partial [Acrasis kona]